MAKALGLIGNFKGKLGNTVGYSLKDSNNKQTQGVRVYQPVVRNPKTYAQAEQRCKLAPINATYRVLKMVIDRGQEGKAYGNKSRLAWLKNALTEFEGANFVKGAVCNLPALVQISKGSIANPVSTTDGWDGIAYNLSYGEEAIPHNVGEMSQGVLAMNPSLHEGDQITFVQVLDMDGVMSASVQSIVLDTTSTESIPSFITATNRAMTFMPNANRCLAGAAIISRMSSSGEHLRSTEKLAIYDKARSKFEAAVSLAEAAQSYMAVGANTDWAEESLISIPSDDEGEGGGEG